MAPPDLAAPEPAYAGPAVPEAASPETAAPEVTGPAPPARKVAPSRPAPPRAEARVHLLVVELGRAPDDGLPKGATGAALLAFAGGVTEAEAVNETVAVLRAAGMAPLTVEGHGTEAEMVAAGFTIGPEERALMQRALAENAVIVLQVSPFTD